MNKLHTAATIGETHVTRLDTLRILCEYIVALRKDIDELRAQVEAQGETGELKIHNDWEEGKTAKRIVIETLK